MVGGPHNVDHRPAAVARPDRQTVVVLVDNLPAEYRAPKTGQDAGLDSVDLDGGDLTWHGVIVADDTTAAPTPERPTVVRCRVSGRSCFGKSGPVRR